MKIITIFLFFHFLCLVPFLSYADDKVVIIPMMKSSVSETSIYGGGKIGSSGAIQQSFGKPFTVEKANLGYYAITLPGYNKKACSNIDDPEIIPIAITTPDTVSIITAPSVARVTCLNGDTVIYVSTYSITGEAEDHNFNLMIVSPN